MVTKVVRPAKDFGAPVGAVGSEAEVSLQAVADGHQVSFLGLKSSGIDRISWEVLR